MYQPSGLLTDREFMLLQGFLGSGYDGLTRLQRSIESGLEVVVFSENVTVESDMLYQFESNWNNVNTVVTKDIMAEATLALLMHVNNRSGQDINEYLYSRSLRVGRSFAELSSGLGYSIYPINIQV
jgi:hypothetical protein